MKLVRLREGQNFQGLEGLSLGGMCSAQLLAEQRHFIGHCLESCRVLQETAVIAHAG